jgi:uncharacterized membrane protein
MRRFRFVAADMPSKNRVEALVDGIFSVAMTLLVLDIKLPEGVQLATNDELIRHFASVGASFAVYLISFFVLAMFWVGHHYQFRYVRRLDRGLLWINFGFLLLTTLVPFSTNLVATHGNLSFAVTVYAANLFLLGAALLLHGQVLLSRREVATEEFTTAIGTEIRARLALICVVPLLAICAAQLSPRLGISMFWLLALLHFIPRAIKPAEARQRNAKAASTDVD